MFYVSAFIIIVFTLLVIKQKRILRDSLCVSSVFLGSFFFIFVLAPLLYEDQGLIEDTVFQTMMIPAFLLLVYSLAKVGPMRPSRKRFNLRFRWSLSLTTLYLIYFLIFLFNAISLLVLLRGQELNSLFEVHRVGNRLENYASPGGGMWKLLDAVVRQIFAIFVGATLAGTMSGRFRIRVRNANRLSTKQLSRNLSRNRFQEMPNFRHRVRFSKNFLPIDRQVKYLVFPVVAIYFLTALEAFFFAAHRTTVAGPLLLSIFIFHFYYKRLSIPVLSLTAICFLIGFGIFDYIRHGQNLSESNTTITASFLKGGTGLATSRSFHEMYEALTVDESLEFENGKQLWLYNPVTLIPRAVWPEKPFVSFSARTTEDMYGTIGTGNWVRTFTIWGEGFRQLGWIGVMLYSVIVIAGIRSLFWWLSRYEGSEIIALNILCTMPILIRASLFSFYGAALWTVLSVCVLRYFLWGTSRKRNHSWIFTSILR